MIFIDLSCSSDNIRHRRIPKVPLACFVSSSFPSFHSCINSSYASDCPRFSSRFFSSNAC